MADERTRELERAARAGDPDARVVLLHARVRTGALARERVELGAFLGDASARRVFDTPAATGEVDLREVARFGLDAAAQLLIAFAEARVTGHVELARADEDGAVAAFLEAARAFRGCPCAEHDRDRRERGDALDVFDRNLRNRILDHLQGAVEDLMSADEALSAAWDLAGARAAAQVAGRRAPDPPLAWWEALDREVANDVFSPASDPDEALARAERRWEERWFASSERMTRRADLRPAMLDTIKAWALDAPLPEIPPRKRSWWSRLRGETSDTGSVDQAVVVDALALVRSHTTFLVRLAAPDLRALVAASATLRGVLRVSPLPASEVLVLSSATPAELEPGGDASRFTREAPMMLGVPVYEARVLTHVLEPVPGDPRTREHHEGFRAVVDARDLAEDHDDRPGWGPGLDAPDWPLARLARALGVTRAELLQDPATRESIEIPLEGSADLDALGRELASLRARLTTRAPREAPRPEVLLMPPPSAADAVTEEAGPVPDLVDEEPNFVQAMRAEESQAIQAMERTGSVINWVLLVMILIAMVAGVMLLLQRETRPAPVATPPGPAFDPTALRVRLVGVPAGRARRLIASFEGGVEHRSDLPPGEQARVPIAPSGLATVRIEVETEAGTVRLVRDGVFIEPDGGSIELRWPAVFARLRGEAPPGSRVTASAQLAEAVGFQAEATAGPDGRFALEGLPTVGCVATSHAPGASELHTCWTVGGQRVALGPNDVLDLPR